MSSTTHLTTAPARPSLHWASPRYSITQIGSVTIGFVTSASSMAVLELATPNGNAFIEVVLDRNAQLSEADVVTNAAVALILRGWHVVSSAKNGSLTIMNHPAQPGHSDLNFVTLLQAVSLGTSGICRLALLAADSTGWVAKWSLPWHLYPVTPLQLATHLVFTVLPPEHPRFHLWLLYRVACGLGWTKSGPIFL